jgi:hypothetical protein
MNAMVNSRLSAAELFEEIAAMPPLEKSHPEVFAELVRSAGELLAEPVDLPSTVPTSAPFVECPRCGAPLFSPPSP